MSGPGRDLKGKPLTKKVTPKLSEDLYREVKEFRRQHLHDIDNDSHAVRHLASLGAAALAANNNIDLKSFKYVQINGESRDIHLKIPRELYDSIEAFRRSHADQLTSWSDSFRAFLQAGLGPAAGQS